MPYHMNKIMNIASPIYYFSFIFGISREKLMHNLYPKQSVNKK